MAPAFPVPAEYRALGPSPERLAWVDRMPEVAARLAQRWRLLPDGEPRYGFLSTVWPVRDHGGRPLVLKVHEPFPGTEGERLALAAGRGPGLVDLVAADPSVNALLLERLDPDRTLESMPEPVATAVVGDLIGQITSHDAPEGLRSLADEADRIASSIEGMLHRTPAVLPRASALRAMATMTELAEEVRAGRRRQVLLHGDLHYANVLHTLPAQPPRWVAIDPLPAAGFPEWEVAAAMRNRWEDAVATGDAGRALRRRLDVLCDRAGLDRGLALDVLRAIAVDNVLWLTGDPQAHPIRQSHLQAYSVIAGW